MLKGTLMKHVLLAAALLLALLPCVTRAAAPLSVAVDEVYAFRHLVDDHDFLVLARYRLVPAEQGMTDAFSGIVVDANGNTTTMKLTNRHSYSTTEDMTVLVNNVDVTAYCQVLADYQSIECANIPSGTLAAGTYGATVSYVGGWDAYSQSAAIFQLLDANGTVVSQRNVPATGHGIVGIYKSTSSVSDTFAGDGATKAFALTRTHFYTNTTGMTASVGGTATTAYSYDSATETVTFDSAPGDGQAVVVTYTYTGGIKWTSGIQVTLMGSPTLWANNSSVTDGVTLRATASQAETATQLNTDCRTLLQYLERDDPLVAGGQYVTADGITSEGRSLLNKGFALIGEVIPESFQPAHYNPFHGFTPEPTSYVGSIDDETGATTVGQAWERLGEQFGVGKNEMGPAVFGGVALLVALGILLLTGKVGGQPSWPFAVFGAWTAFATGWLLGAVSWQWVGLAGAVILIPSILWIFTERVFR